MVLIELQSRGEFNVHMHEINDELSINVAISNGNIAFL
jgi:hypothetical protein